MRGPSISVAPNLASRASSISSSEASGSGRLWRICRPSGSWIALIRCPFTSRLECPLALDLMVALNMTSKLDHLNGLPSKRGTSRWSEELLKYGATVGGLWIGVGNGETGRSSVHMACWSSDIAASSSLHRAAKCVTLHRRGPVALEMASESAGNPRVRRNEETRAVVCLLLLGSGPARRCSHAREDQLSSEWAMCTWEPCAHRRAGLSPVLHRLRGQGALHKWSRFFLVDLRWPRLECEGRLTTRLWEWGRRCQDVPLAYPGPCYEAWLFVLFDGHAGDGDGPIHR